MTQKNLKLIKAYARRLVKITGYASTKKWKQGEREAVIRNCADWIICVVGPKS
jgi:hypothetical protein